MQIEPMLLEVRGGLPEIPSENHAVSIRWSQQRPDRSGESGWTTTSRHHFNNPHRAVLLGREREPSPSLRLRVEGRCGDGTGRPLRPDPSPRGIILCFHGDSGTTTERFFPFQKGVIHLERRFKITSGCPTIRELSGREGVIGSNRDRGLVEATFRNPSSTCISSLKDSGIAS
jgi:hypothetical protein